MKKLKCIIPALFVFVLLVPSYSQTKKGDILIGGNSSFNLGFSDSKWSGDSSNDSKTNSFQISFAPEIGFLVFDNLAIGFSLPVQYKTYSLDQSCPKRFNGLIKSAVN